MFCLFNIFRSKLESNFELLFFVEIENKLSLDEEKIFFGREMELDRNLNYKFESIEYLF